MLRLLFTLSCCFIVVFSQATLSPSICPDGSAKYGDYCYKYIEQAQPWKDAQTTCQTLGGSLAEIFTDDENNFVRQVMIAHNSATIWLGASEKDGKWLWASGDDLDYNDWAPNQPDTRVPEHCMEFNIKDWGSHWNNDECVHKEKFICKIYSNPPTCSGGFQLYDSSCYIYVEQGLPWGDAQEKCKSMGAFLPEIFSQGQNDFVKQMMVSHNSDAIWLGGVDIGGQWHWNSSGVALDGFSDWAPNQPDTRVSEHCMEFNIKDWGSHWNNDECIHKQKFICQKSVAVDIPIGK